MQQSRRTARRKFNTQLKLPTAGVACVSFLVTWVSQFSVIRRSSELLQMNFPRFLFTHWRSVSSDSAEIASLYPIKAPLKVHLSNLRATDYLLGKWAGQPRLLNMNTQHNLTINVIVSICFQEKNERDDKLHPISSQIMFQINKDINTVWLQDTQLVKKACLHWLGMLLGTVSILKCFRNKKKSNIISRNTLLIEQINKLCH